ncbi:MAG: hypothetical protein WCB04_10335 [Mycobacteriales bacterium]
MRASDLIGRGALCRDGSAGNVIDLRLRAEPQPGRPATEVGELRIEALVVSPGHWGGTIGYDRRSEGRPWLLWRAVRWLHRKDRYVRWDLVEDWTGEVVSIDADRADLPAVSEIID